MPQTQSAATPDTTHEIVSVPAILAYVLLVEMFLAGLGIFILIMYKVKVDPVMLAILGAFLAALYGFVNMGIGFYFGSSSGGKIANAALAQLAGAGAPPPAQPLSPQDPTKDPTNVSPKPADDVKDA